MKISVTSIVLIIAFSSQALAQGDLHVKGKIRSDSLANSNYLIIYADSTGTLDTLPAGLPGQVLISNGQGGKPYWDSLNTSAGQSILYSNLTTIGTDANTNEKLLASYILSANTLNIDGMGISIYAFGRYANNSNSKTVRLKFGNEVHTRTIGSTPSGYLEWTFETTIYRSTINTQKGISVHNFVVAIAPDSKMITPTEDLSNNVLIQITGQNGVASTNEIVLEGIIISLIK